MQCTVPILAHYIPVYHMQIYQLSTLKRVMGIKLPCRILLHKWLHKLLLNNKSKNVQSLNENGIVHNDIFKITEN